MSQVAHTGQTAEQAIANLNRDTAMDPNWGEGGVYRAILQGVGAGLVAELGNGEGMNAVLGTLASQLASKQIREFAETLAARIASDPGEFELLANFIQNIVSTGVGYAAGGATGGNAASSVDRNNRQLHDLELGWIENNLRQFALELDEDGVLTAQDLEYAKRILYTQALIQVDERAAKYFTDELLSSRGLSAEDLQRANVYLSQCKEQLSDGSFHFFTFFTNDNPVIGQSYYSNPFIYAEYYDSNLGEMARRNAALLEEYTGYKATLPEFMPQDSKGELDQYLAQKRIYDLEWQAKFLSSLEQRGFFDYAIFGVIAWGQQPKDTTTTESPVEENHPGEAHNVAYYEQLKIQLAAEEAAGTTSRIFYADPNGVISIAKGPAASLGTIFVDTTGTAYTTNAINAGKGIPKSVSTAYINSLKANTQIDYMHTLGGDFSKSGKPTGGHSLVNGDVRIVQGTEGAPNANGVYTATVEVYNPNTGQWVLKTSNNEVNTMFPKDWSMGKIATEITGAWNSPTKTISGDMWIAKSPSGVMIEGYLSPRITAYPVK